MAIPLIALIVGIVLSPCLDLTAVWITIFVLIAFTLSSPGGRGFWFRRHLCALLIVVLVGAVDAARMSTVPPDPGDTAARMTGRLTKAPEWRGVGAYLDMELEFVDAQPYRGRARLTEFLDDP